MYTCIPSQAIFSLLFNGLLGLLKVLEALAYAEILLGVALSNDEETSCLFELRMDAHLKVVEVLHLFLGFFVEFYDVLHELFIVACQFLAIFL